MFMDTFGAVPPAIPRHNNFNRANFSITLSNKPLLTSHPKMFNLVRKSRQNWLFLLKFALKLNLKLKKAMQKLFFLMVSMLLGTSIYAQSSNDQILGKWTNEDKSRVIEFVKNGSFYDAVIIKAENSSYIGKKQISNLKFDKNNAYKGGTLHVYQKGRTANCSAKLVSSTKLELKASSGMMSKSQVWTKVAN